MQSFCVIKKQQFAPLSMLHRLWGIEKASEAESVMKMLNDVGLLRQHVKQERGREEVGASIHELVQDHFADKVKGREKEFHRRLLNNYIGVQSEDGPNTSCREWWRMNDERDIYMYKNVVWHLVLGDRIAEAKALLLDPRWTLKQTRTGGMSAAVDDYSLLTEALKALDNGQISEEIEISNCSRVIEALKLVKEAITLASSFVFHNEREVWFQLYGRLIGSIENVEIQQYLEKIRKYAEKPWIRCEEGFIMQAGGIIERSWSVKGELLCAGFGRSRSVIALEKTQGTTNYLCNIWQFGKRDEGRGKLLWCTECEFGVKKSLLSTHGNRIILFCDNGRVGLLDWENRRKSYTRDLHNGNIDCMKLCENGNVVVFASDEHTIEVWRFDKTTLHRVRTLKHDGSVKSAALSPEGKRVAVILKCTNDTNDEREYITEWNISSGAQCGVVEGFKYALSVTYSSHGRMAISTQLRGAAAAHGTEYIFVWDCERLEFLAKVFCIYTLQPSQWSPDGRFFSAGMEESQCLLDVGSAPNEMKWANLGENGRIAAWSADGNLILMKTRNVLNVVRHCSLRWWRMSSMGAREFILVSDNGMQWPPRSDGDVAKWSADGSTIAKISLDDDLVHLCNREGKQHSVVRGRSVKGCTSDVAWAGDMLAVAKGFGVEVWDTQTKRIVAELSCPENLYDMYESLSSTFLEIVSLSEDGKTVVAAGDFTRHVYMFVWSTNESRQLAFPRVTVSHPGWAGVADVACSRNGRFTACAGCVLQNSNLSSRILIVEVYSQNGTRLARLEDSYRFVHRLSFDDDDNLLFEWEMFIEDKRPQFSSWRWRYSGAKLQPCLRTVPYVGDRRYVNDANHLQLATIAESRLWDYNAKANAFVCSSGGKIGVLHLETYES